MSSRETDTNSTKTVSRRDVLKNGVAAAIAGGVTTLSAAGVSAAAQAPAIATGTMAGRKYRAFVRYGTTGSVEELSMLPLDQDRVVVRTEASQCSYTGSRLVLGNGMQQQATIPGYGGVGVVEAIGSRVRRVQVGDRVFVADAPYCGQCYACLRGRADLCLQSGGGGVAF